MDASSTCLAEGTTEERPGSEGNSPGPEELGVGRSLRIGTLNRRDITIRPGRPAPPPPSAAEQDFPLNSPSSLVASPVRSESRALPLSKAPVSSTPQRSDSMSSVTHPPISPSNYTVRSQPIGLARTSSLSEIAPTISGGITRRLSVSSFSSEDEGDEGGEFQKPEPINRPLFKHRSESLPSFPPRDLVDGACHRRKSAEDEELAKLPSNPKLWLPSHLALYLSNALSLHPALAEDITVFIRNSRHSGRTFLRLKPADLEELGVNVRWRGALLEAGDKLRRESLGGRIFWGYEGGRQSDEEGDARRGGGELERSSSSAGSSYPTAFTLPISHRRRPSLEVEGSASEDESSKEEWKRSWRRLNRGTNRVKGLARTFETVIETSERSINVSPAGSPVKNRTESCKRSSRTSTLEDAGMAGRSRSDSLESNLSAASVDSFSGRYTSIPVQSSPSVDERASSPELVPSFSSPEIESSFTRAFPVTPVKKDPLTEHRVSFAAEYDWRLFPNSPEFRRRTKSAASGGPTGDDEEDTNAEEEWTLKPIRTASTATSGGSSGSFALSPASTEKRAGLADLFGLEMPKSRKASKKVDLEDEMVEMLVPGVEESGRGGRKGSMVLIKKSQFAALQHRMEEVEAQVALALESNGFQSPRKIQLDSKENEVDQLEGRLIGLEHQTRLLASISPDRSPLKDRNYHSPLCPARSRSTTTDDDALSQDPKAWWSDEVSPLGWRALGGYVVAASIGIGIVAGEVVAAKLLGVSRRR